MYNCGALPRFTIEDGHLRIKLNDLAVNIQHIPMQMKKFFNYAKIC